MYELIMNGNTYYVVDGFIYTIDTIVIEDLFNNIQVSRPEHDVKLLNYCFYLKISHCIQSRLDPKQCDGYH